MASNSKEIVRALLRGQTPSRPPFIPIVASAAAQLMQVSVEEMFSDATCLANNFQNCQRLFGYDAVVILHDQTLEAEACGCAVEWQEDAPPKLLSHVAAEPPDVEVLNISDVERKGRLPVVLEATKRLILTMGKEVAFFGVVTGPVTLARHLSGESLEQSYDSMPKILDKTSSISLKMVRSFCELRVDAIVLADDDLPGFAQSHHQQIASALKPIYNIAKFYNGYLIIQAKELPKESLQNVLRLQADGFSLGGQDDSQVLQEAVIERRLLFGANLSAGTLVDSKEKVEQVTMQILKRCKGQRFFISTQGEVPFATPASSLHKIMECSAFDQG